MVQKFNAVGGSIESQSLEEFIESTFSSLEADYALNSSENILLLIDEAHRSHSNTLHAYLSLALPNAAKIGFTGTPIVSAEKKRTTEIFGKYIDVYSIRDSQKDRVTVPIHYEGLESLGAVKNANLLDQLFDVLFPASTYTEEQRAQIRARVNKSDVRQAKEMMKAKARHMLRHYITRIMPHKFKAQVAAISREACVNYQRYLTEARDELIQELEEKAIILQDLKLEDVEDEPLRILVHAHRYLDTIKRLEFAAIISADSKKDPSDWKQWTEETNHTTYKNRFWEPLENDGLAFLIVQNKLLVGFDAPLEQVLYIDRNLEEHGLLQAIARTNRTAEGKDYGLIVDYYGIDIGVAMSVYDDEDVDGAWFDIQEELPKLDEAHRRVMGFWQKHGLDINGDLEACANLLSDERLRAEFYTLLRNFLKQMDEFLPRPHALRYLKDAKRLGQIKKLVDDIYRDEVSEDTKKKVQSLIDQHIEAQGIDLRIEPVDILSFDFEQRIRQRRSPRTRAAEMEHAIRHHIRTHLDDDPVYYRNLSEKLEEILTRLGEDWDARETELVNLAQQTRAEQSEATAGQPDAKIRPFYNAIVDVLESPSEEIKQQVQEFSTTLVEFIYSQTNIRNFWNDLVLRNNLRSQIWLKLEECGLLAEDILDGLADTITQQAERHDPNQGQ